MESEENQFGLIRASSQIRTLSQLPSIDLFVVPHQGGKLVTARFGPGSYETNVAQMGEEYFHSPKVPRISFRQPRTDESISVVEYQFKEGREIEIHNYVWVQAGILVQMKDGVIVNPPLDEKGNVVLSPIELRRFIDRAKVVTLSDGKQISFGENGFGYTPFDSFSQGLQNVNTFTEEGLARIIEGAIDGPAIKLREIVSPNNYIRGVDVCGFHSSIEPVKRVLGLGPDRSMDFYRLDVSGFHMFHHDNGYVFGVPK